MMKAEGGMSLRWYSREKVRDATLCIVFRLTRRNRTRESSSGFLKDPPNRGCRSTAVMKSRSATGRTITQAPLACSTHSQEPCASNQTAPRMEHDGDNHARAALSWCGDNLQFNDLLITIDFEARDILLHAARPEDFNIYGLIRGQRSQPEDDPLIVRREIA